MKTNFNATGPARKALVKAIESIMGEKAKYQGMPTSVYTLGDITIDKEGSVICEDGDKLERLVHNLIADGFTPSEENEPEETGLTIEIPLEHVQVGNLMKLLDAKGKLIQKALGMDDIRIEIKEDRVAFPWFSTLPEPDEVKAYSHFITALCKLAKDAKRVNATEKEVDNEKYAFRCFLLRLGFIGSEYKAERKTLLRNLSGSSAFKSGSKKTEVETCA